MGAAAGLRSAVGFLGNLPRHGRGQPEYTFAVASRISRHDAICLRFIAFLLRIFVIARPDGGDRKPSFSTRLDGSDGAAASRCQSYQAGRQRYATGRREEASQSLKSALPAFANVERGRYRNGWRCSKSSWTT